MDIPESKESLDINNIQIELENPKELKQIYYARTEPISDVSNPTSIDIHVYTDGTDAIHNIKDIITDNIFYIRLEPSANDGYTTTVYDNNNDFINAIRNDMPSEPVTVTSTDPSEATRKDPTPVRNEHGVAESNVPSAPEPNWDPTAALQAIKNNNATSIVQPIIPEPAPAVPAAPEPEPIAPVASEPVASEQAIVKPALNPIKLTKAQARKFNILAKQKANNNAKRKANKMALKASNP